MRLDGPDVGLRGKLAGNDDLVATIAKGPADQLLAVPIAIAQRRVEEIDAEVVGKVQASSAAASSTGPSPDAPAPKPDLADLDSGLASSRYSMPASPEMNAWRLSAPKRS
jgi:hypothetical protein